MTTPADLARRCLAAGESFAVVTIAAVEGSAPREAGAAMVIARTQIAGTIGGGRLEWEAVERARLMLDAPSKTRTKPDVISVIPLGPALGQCCGGRVTLRIEAGGALQADRLAAEERAAGEARPHAFIYGAGHVGRALAGALSLLPLRVTLADARPGELALWRGGGVEILHSEAPAAVASAAPAGAAHAVMTHSHALDSLIAAQLLEDGGFAYLGVIGSATKKAVFLKAFRALGLSESAIARMRCPIGGDTLRDKRPEIIAAIAAAEIATALFGKNGG